VSEDGVYLPLPAERFEEFSAVALEIPSVRGILDAYSSCLSIDLLQEMQHPHSSGIDRRILETGMYAAFAFYLEARFGLRPRALSFYSSGVAPALIFSESISPIGYLENLAPFHSANRHAYVAVERCLSIAQTRLEAEPDEDIEAFVETLLKESGGGHSVFIKDRRHKHTLLVAGEKEAIALVRERVGEAFPSVARRAPKLVDTSSAHLPLYDRAPLEEVLSHVAFDRPRFKLIGIDGDSVEAGCASQGDLRRLVHRAAFGFMDTGRVVRKASADADRLIVVGSPFGARVLDRTHLGGFLKAELATSYVAEQMQRTTVEALDNSRARLGENGGSQC